MSENPKPAKEFEVLKDENALDRETRLLNFYRELLHDEAELEYEAQRLKEARLVLEELGSRYHIDLTKAGERLRRG